MSRFFSPGLWRVEQDNSNASCNRLENPIGFANIRSRLGNPFGHMTRTFLLRMSRGNVTVFGNRLHLNLPVDFL